MTSQPDLGQLAGRRMATSVSTQDEIVRGHLVHATPVLPGVFFLDLVLRLVRHCGLDPSTVELRRCLFIAPVVAAGTRDRQLQVSVGEPAGRGTVPVTVRSRPVSNGLVLDDTWEVNFTAELRVAEARPDSTVELERLVARAEESMDADALYAFARQVEIHHRDFMKVDGTVYRGAGYSLGEVRLGEAAQGYLDYFHIHPVMLDFATLVPFLQFDAEQRATVRRPFIPIYIESFWAPGGLGSDACVYVPEVTQRELDAETVTADIRICRPDGTAAAVVTGFRAKRVRSAELITRLAAEGPAAPPPAGLPASPNGHHPASLEQAVAGLVGAALGDPTSTVDLDRGFYDLGLTSVDLLTIAAELERRLGRELYPTLLFEHPTVRGLAAHLRAEGLVPDGEPAPPEPAPVVAPRTEPYQPEPAGDIAIVGLAGRYPGARTVAEFWNLLRDGRDCVEEIPADRWDHRPYFDPVRDTPGKTYGRWGAFIDGVADFDPLFFHISPRQAELMDPHERLFLQTAWETIEDAGHSPEDLARRTDGAVGVFAGVMWSDYQLYALAELGRGNPHVVASTFSLIANRVSYAFDFRGPSVSLDTACSSSLTTIHLACESIRRGECRAAVAGGVNLSLHPYKYLRLAEHHLLSTDGRCRVFGAGADGYVPGEGVGAVLLRPLADALADGDHVYGVIRASALQHSGRTSGFAVPSPDAQSRVVGEALARSGVDVETITYIEAHGGATTLGDQIEIAALTKTFRRYTERSGFCAVGSLKSNVGHLEAAAGVAALTKVLLSLRYRTIVPSLHTDRPNPEIPFAGSPFYVARERLPWQPGIDRATGRPAPLRGALSAFGFGGANVHLIVEEYPAAQPAVTYERPVVVPLSARDEDGLRAMALRLRDHLAAEPTGSIVDIAYTLQAGRRHLEHRLAVVARDLPELRDALNAYLDGVPRNSIVSGKARQFAGGGSDAVHHSPAEIAAAWVAGQDPPWPVLDGARRVSLPTYPFARQRCWIPGTGAPFPDVPAAVESQPEPADPVLLYAPSWYDSPLAGGGSLPSGPIVVLDGNEARATALRSTGRRVILVRPGRAFARHSADEYELVPDVEDGYRQLVAALDEFPAAVLHLWTLADDPSEPRLEHGLTSMFLLCRALVVRCPERLPVVFGYPGPDECPTHAAVGGFARSLRREQPKLAVKTVRLAGTGPEAQSRALLAEAGALDDIEVRLNQTGRTVLGFHRVRPPEQGVPLARAGGVYLITGGAGGLGRIVARHLAATARVGVALLGRSGYGPEQAAATAELESMGSKAIYLSVDVADPDAVARAIEDTTRRLGPVTGVIHAAGVVEDGLLVNKEIGSFHRVVAPKMAGTAHLDAALASADLDYFVLFSSTTSVLGTVGTTDYTAANRYLDEFAAYRERLRAQGFRRGRTVAVNWPLWRDGGMRINPAVERPVLEVNGLRPLDTVDGLAALAAALCWPGTQLAVFRGDQQRIEQRLTMAPVTEAPAAEAPASTVDELVTELAEIFADLLKVPVEQLDPDEELADFGVDSVASMRMLDRMERRHGTALPPAIVAQHRTIRSLARRLAGELPAPSGQPEAAEPTPVAAPRSVAPEPEPTGAIAVVAVAGRFPGARDVDEFWRNLSAGIRSISPVPPNRWDPTWLAGADPETATAARWGGFLTGVDEFDNKFFGISDEDAAWMDPQQRIALEVAQELLDRAGYRRDEVAGEPIGIFLGVAPNDYTRRGVRAGAQPTDRLLVNSLPNMVAAGISHGFHFTGPAITVDTACSSALIAVHQAVRSLRAGECGAAIAGGIELLLDPFVYMGLAKAGALSVDGHTRVFAADSGGVVPAEGIGLAMLKPLARAQADGDQILAVILGTATNNDGHTLGLTAPSPQAQTDVIRAALGTAGVSADTIGYLEVNGSASGFGDPIEVHAAADAYGQDTDRRGYCAIGSVKANVGAMLHAGGAASLVKMVLAVHHGFLPPTRYADELHPRLALDRTPFYPVTEGRSWPGTAERPRRAGVSSFGFGGSNCHVILEQPPAGHAPGRTPLPATRFERRARSIEGWSTVDRAVDPVAYLTDVLSALAGVERDAAQGGHTFAELGLESADVIRLTERLESDLGREVPPTIFFRYPDVPRLAAFLGQEYAQELSRLNTNTTKPLAGRDIAVIGMAGVFPGAGSIDELWPRLLDGADLVGPVPATRWNHADYYDPAGGTGRTDCPAGGFLSDVDAFDADLFGVLPDEARAMDPQSRLLLQVLWSAAEHAGVAGRLRGSDTGVYVGQCFRDYDEELIAGQLPIGAYEPIGTAVSMTANRPSHFFDLSGPSLTIDTACSSSLYAVHLAVAALRRGECGMAFAAGSNLILSPRHYLQLSAIGALSPSGRCHAFDSRADGYVPGEAVAAVLLKPLAAALADGDPIHGVIRGSAVNHGGHATSVTAPNPERQSALLRQAWADARVTPETIGYLEAHGTGTVLGDPIEVDAIRAAMAEAPWRPGGCLLGTAKANLGHTEGAAGIVGIIKAILAVRDGEVPPMPGFGEPNRYCGLGSGPLRVNTARERWALDGPRRAGVSSFGFGGAYAHVVVEEPPRRPATVPAAPKVGVFPYSATDAGQLVELLSRHRDFLRANEPELAGVASTLHHGRQALPVRAAVLASDRDGLLRGIEQAIAAGGPGLYGQPVSGGEGDLARSFVSGANVQWPTSTATRLALPGYPFRKLRYWIGATVPSTVVDPMEPVDSYLARCGYDGGKVATGLRELGTVAARMLRGLLRDRIGTAEVSRDSIRTGLGVEPRYERLLDAILGVLHRAGSGPVPTLPELRRRYPELSAHIALVEGCLPGLPSVLAGEREPLELYFSADEPDLLPRIYRGNAVADHYNELVAQAVAGYASALLSRRPGQPVRILEVGAGTGGTTDRVLQVLAERPEVASAVRYRFTDVSASFFQATEREFGGRGIDLRFEVLDLERPLTAQGFSSGDVDVVVAANVVHATKRVRASLGRIRELLAPGGVLILNEVTNNLDYLALMFGMIPGWWAFEDAAERLAGSPLLDPASWRRALLACGFDDVRVFGAPGLGEEQLDQSVLVARAAATAPAPMPAPAAPAPAVTPTPIAPPVREPLPVPLPRGDLSGSVRAHLCEVFAAFFRLPVSAIDPLSTFDAYGLDSLGAIQLVRNLETHFGRLPKVLLYECTTINELVDDLLVRNPAACEAIAAPGEPASPPPVVAAVPDPVVVRPEPVGPEPIAIIGMAAHLPGSTDLAGLWRNLRDGADLVTEVPADRFDWRRVYGDPSVEPGKTNSRWGAFIDGVANFDAEFFGISPLEADLMDPQQRLFLQLAWWAVEDAGYRPAQLAGTRTGVFVGATSHDYDLYLTEVGRDREAHSSSGLAHCIIANRVSFQLDLRGPSQTVDTACSSSLTALHNAVRSLQSGDCDLAIAGGVHLLLTENLYVALGQLGMMSPDGRCMTFDRRANGFVRGEGVGALLLKPLRQALADRDTVHAVVLGSGLSHGGHVQSLTIPNPAAQADLIAAVYRRSGVDPRGIGYIEAHGTGTVVGDPIEVRGLRKAFAQVLGRPEDEPVDPWCGIGTIKSNMGHLEAAAGLAGVLRTVLAMRQEILPASIHCTDLNPLLEIEGSPFYVVDTTRPWPADGGPRRAGVSSMGFGGANAHVVLEQSPQPAGSTVDGGPELVVLSARTEERLREYARRLLNHLRTSSADGVPKSGLADIAYTLQVGREPMAWRLAVVATDREDLESALAGYLAGAGPTGTVCHGRIGQRAAITSTVDLPRPAANVADLCAWAGAWVSGIPVDWTAIRPATALRYRVPLPGYPFAPDRHWAYPEPEAAAPVSPAVNLPAAGREDRMRELLTALQRGEISVPEADRLLATSENGART